MKCNNCNYEYDKNSEFCPNCGYKVDKTQKKNSKKVLLYSLIAVILIALISIVVLIIVMNLNPKKSSVSDRDNGQVETKQKATKKKNEIGGYEYYSMDIDAKNMKIIYDGDLGKNIKVDKVIYDKNGLHVLATNNNSIPVYPDVDLYFLDENGQRVDKGLGNSTNVGANKKFATDVGSTSKKEFYSYELHISANKTKSYEHMLDIDETKLDITETDQSIQIKYKNDLEQQINLYISIVYYKNNEIHFFDDLYLYVKPGEEEKIDSYYFYLPAGDLNTKDFDRYEVIISSAKYNDSTY